MIDSPAVPEPLPRRAGWAVFGTLAVFVVVGAVRRSLDRPVLGLFAAAVALAASAASIFGPRRLLLPFAGLAGAALVVLGNGQSSNVGWFGLVALAGWCALAASRLIAAGYLISAVLVLVGEAVFVRVDPGWMPWVAGTVVTSAACYLGRRQRDLLGRLRAAQAGLALRAQAEERNRIARELHDVIAHSLTVSLLHVSSARLAVRDDPADAERALAEAERLGRASLQEVRHAVGLLHDDSAADPTAPLPGSTDVAQLIEGFRSAGADVRATVEGDLAAVPATVGLAAYRIVQESLTNAAKHAPGRPATVHVAVTAEAVRVDVDSAGAPGTGRGIGLVSMRERAESLGGAFSAGPGGSGWRVHAELPLPGRAA
ncbi:MAG TPA: histidine kinase [Jatrophihabitans sp.]|uniref:sensor histidine kinase n=1 Tax=Jatrophihabitans sp. TaxID=1932789 RepID=UPI002E0922ED|nr:histidine kinase [Jatrophihabitans sp.]